MHPAKKRNFLSIQSIQYNPKTFRDDNNSLAHKNINLDRLKTDNVL